MTGAPWLRVIGTARAVADGRTVAARCQERTAHRRRETDAPTERTRHRPRTVALDEIPDGVTGAPWLRVIGAARAVADGRTV